MPTELARPPALIKLGKVSTDTGVPKQLPPLDPGMLRGTVPSD